MSIHFHQCFRFFQRSFWWNGSSSLLQRRTAKTSKTNSVWFIQKNLQTNHFFLCIKKSESLCLYSIRLFFFTFSYRSLSHIQMIYGLKTHWTCQRTLRTITSPTAHFLLVKESVFSNWAKFEEPKSFEKFKATDKRYYLGHKQNFDHIWIWFAVIYVSLCLGAINYAPVNFCLSIDP